MRRCIRLLATLLVLQGCCPKFYPQTTTTVEHFEVVKEVVRDTVVQVQPDSSILQALIKCDSTGRARLQGISRNTRNRDHNREGSQHPSLVAETPHVGRSREKIIKSRIESIYCFVHKTIIAYFWTKYRTIL